LTEVSISQKFIRDLAIGFGLELKYGIDLENQGYEDKCGEFFSQSCFLWISYYIIKE